MGWPLVLKELRRYLIFCGFHLYRTENWPFVLNELQRWRIFWGVRLYRIEIWRWGLRTVRNSGSRPIRDGRRCVKKSSAYFRETAGRKQTMLCVHRRTSSRQERLGAAVTPLTLRRTIQVRLRHGPLALRRLCLGAPPSLDCADSR